jgi:hypothetical protein
MFYQKMIRLNKKTTDKAFFWILTNHHFPAFFKKMWDKAQPIRQDTKPHGRGPHTNRLACKHTRFTSLYLPLSDHPHAEVVLKESVGVANATDLGGNCHSSLLKELPHFSMAFATLFGGSCHSFLPSY